MKPSLHRHVKLYSDIRTSVGTHIALFIQGFGWHEYRVRKHREPNIPRGHTQMERLFDEPMHIEFNAQLQ